MSMLTVPLILAAAFYAAVAVLILTGRGLVVRLYAQNWLAYLVVMVLVAVGGILSLIAPSQHASTLAMLLLMIGVFVLLLAVVVWSRANQQGRFNNLVKYLQGIPVHRNNKVQKYLKKHALLDDKQIDQVQTHSGAVLMNSLRKQGLEVDDRVLYYPALVGLSSDKLWVLTFIMLDKKVYYYLLRYQYQNGEAKFDQDVTPKGGLVQQTLPMILLLPISAHH